MQCCVGAVVCAVEEIEKSTLFWGEGGQCDQDAQKFNFITKCLNTFVAHCSRQIIYIGLQKKSDTSYYKRL